MYKASKADSQELARGSDGEREGGKKEKHHVLNNAGREGGREGRRGGREGRRGGREGGEGGREGRREGGKEGGREGEREGGKDGEREECLESSVST